MRSKGLIFLVAAFVLLFAQAGVAQEDVSKYPSKPITLCLSGSSGDGDRPIDPVDGQGTGEDSRAAGGRGE